jgi:type IV secretory pathway TraG/TraD family ATPase VirD4
LVERELPKLEVAGSTPVRRFRGLPASLGVALLSQAGGQGLKVYFGLQDMAQAANAWGQLVADAFMTMFQVKVILSGIGHPPTLEGISLALGEYDRNMVSSSVGLSDPQEWFSAETHTDTVNYQTMRQRVLPPGEIARMPKGQALLLQGMDWQPMKLTKWYESEPWRTVGGEEALQRTSPREGVFGGLF